MHAQDGLNLHILRMLEGTFLLDVLLQLDGNIFEKLGI